MDGFASFHAPYAEKKIFTRPFVFEGNRMELNFATFDGDLSRLSGEAVTMEITMRDANVFSFRFFEEK